jgi:hypothetical protein
MEESFLHDLESLIDHIADVPYARVHSGELDEVLKRRFIMSLARGSFSIILPQCMVEDIYAFGKEHLTQGHDKVVLAIQTKHGGLMAFSYMLGLAPEGVEFSPAIDIHVPRRPQSKAMPPVFTTLPILILDVGMV